MGCGQLLPSPDAESHTHVTDKVDLGGKCVQFDHHHTAGCRTKSGMDWDVVLVVWCWFYRHVDEYVNNTDKEIGLRYTVWKF